MGEAAVYDTVISDQKPITNVSFLIQTPGLICDESLNWQPTFWLHYLCL